MTFKPYAHQTEALQRMAGRDVFALLMAMRTGKTKRIDAIWSQHNLRKRGAGGHSPADLTAYGTGVPPNHLEIRTCH